MLAIARENKFNEKKVVSPPISPVLNNCIFNKFSVTLSGLHIRTELEPG